MNDDRINPVFGRKIFFLSPALIIKKVVLTKLQEMEYEIYIIEDSRWAKTILRNFPDAIVYINIDQQLTTEEWYNFIKSFKNDDVLSTILVGIISERANTSLKNKFLMNIDLPGGFVNANATTAELIAHLKGVFEINGAKGRRHYVRADCHDDNTAVMRFGVGRKTYKLQIIDISAIGASCLCYDDIRLETNSVIRNATLYIGQKRVVCNMVVYAVKPSGGGRLLVMLFMKDTPPATRETVRNFVFDSLTQKMHGFTGEERRDDTNYAEAQTDDPYIDPNMEVSVGLEELE